ncbi:tripartite tricarboxylate transporter TctB family protein [Microbacterium sp. gxy059]|uniref:tripartite tricarboxylate transporter TctB family protein n=1 Tax=Microbacterium sp. gxy059 TaxID=2957199 RepID=UPI003D966796
MMPSNNPTAVSAVVGRELEVGTGRSELLKNLIMPAVLVIFATYLLVGIITMDVPEGTSFPGPGFFPGIIAAGLYLFSAMLVVQGVRERRAAAAEREAAIASGEIDPVIEAEERIAAGESQRVGVDWRSLAWVVGSFLGFALALNVLGWIIAAGLLFWCVARGFGSTKPVASLVVGFTMSSVAYIAFDMALGMTLPSGILGWGF